MGKVYKKGYEKLNPKEKNLRDRCSKLLKNSYDNGLTKEQKHLDKGTPEREYWHYGYGMALYDVLRNFKLVEKNKGGGNNGETNN